MLPALNEGNGLPQYIQWLPRRNPEKFVKPSRGVFQLVNESIAEATAAVLTHSDSDYEGGDEEFTVSASSDGDDLEDGKEPEATIAASEKKTTAKKAIGKASAKKATKRPAVTKPAAAIPQPPANSSKPIVFLSYPFRPQTEWIKHSVPQLLRLYGCQPVSGDSYAGLEISSAIASDIKRSKLLVAFFTKDQKLLNDEWTPSQWVLQEVGFARGCGVPVLVIRELGVYKEAGILGNVQMIPLDAETEAFSAFVRLRYAIKKLLLDEQSDEKLSVCHLAKPGKRDARGKQWWDVWIWIDGSEESLGTIASVQYQFPESFSPPIEEGDPAGSFGNYLETDEPVNVGVKIRYRPGHGPKQQMVKHKITLPHTTVTSVPWPEILFADERVSLE
jgi:hypothetical protein